MNEQLKDTLIEVLTYFKTGLDDIEAGSEERQTMQDEIDFALPLVKKLLIHSVVKSSCPACKVEHTENDCDGYCTAACLQGC
jgi:hypothetical protein